MNGIPRADDSPNSPSSGARSADSRARPRWALLGAMLWVGVFVSASALVLNLAWRDDLHDSTGVMLLMHWTAFMARTFAYHAGLAMVPVVGVALLIRRRRLALVAGLAGVVGFGPELADGLTRRADVPAGGTLTVLSANLFYGRAEPRALLAVVQKEQPDVLVFQEWTPAASARLRPMLDASFPYHVESPRDDAFGQAVFSRRPLTGEPKLYPPGVGTREPEIVADVDLDGRRLRLVNVHLLPPAGLGLFREQRGIARGLSEWARDAAPGERLNVLVGDFNAVARSSILGAFRRQGFREAHAQAGAWRGTTWPRTGVLRWLPGVRIDNALVAPEVAVLEARVAGDVGSDHRPIVFRIGWKAETFGR